MPDTIDVAEPRVVRDLEQKALENLRGFFRNLGKLSRMTGVDQFVNFTRFMAEVTAQAKPATDPRVAQAVERGVAVRQKLTEAEGGSLSAEEAAKELGMSKVAILKRYQKGRILAWREERQKAIRFPAWQFKNGRVLAGLEDTIAKLNAGSRLDDFGRMLFFLSNSRFLGGKRPLDCLRDGELHKVMQLAEGYGQ
jgi:hypothetical protein